MRKNILIISITTLLFSMGLAVTSCEDGIITETDRPIESIDTTLPQIAMANFEYIADSIFTPTCAVSGCHNGAGLQPNLLKDNIKNLVGSNFIDTSNAATSKIISKMREPGGAVMPPPYSQFQPHPSAVVDSVEKWIGNGAKSPTE